MDFSGLGSANRAININSILIGVDIGTDRSLVVLDVDGWKHQFHVKDRRSLRHRPGVCMGGSRQTDCSGLESVNRASIFIVGGIGTDITGRTGCRWVQISVQCEVHTDFSIAAAFCRGKRKFVSELAPIHGLPRKELCDARASQYTRSYSYGRAPSQ